MLQGNHQQQKGMAEAAMEQGVETGQEQGQQQEGVSYV